MNTTLKFNPNNMQIIISIQNMSEKIGNRIEFKTLENKTYLELTELQNSLTNDYNKAI